MRSAPSQTAPARRLRAVRTTIAAGVLCAAFALPPASAPAAFAPVDVPGLNGKKLFDLGVADLDRDGALDIFSVNHKFPAASLLNEGGFDFTDRTVGLGLSLEPLFPGLEHVDRSPVLDERGLYVHFRRAPGPRGGTLLRLRSKGERASGHVSFASHLVNAERSRDATYSLTETARGAKQLDFDLAKGGELAFRVIYADLPMSFRIGRPGPIFVGADAVRARSPEFSVRLPDRHGYVMAPIDGSGSSDLYIVGGGLNGAAARPIYEGLVADEVLLAGVGGRLRHARPSPLPRKAGCRGRAGAATDADADGDIDLFANCDGEPFLLSLRGPDGRFTPAPPLPYVADAYHWMDAGGDLGVELITAKGPTLAVWRLRAGEWTLVQRINGAAPEDRPVQSFATGDLDGDKDLDLLALSGGGNTLLLREGARMVGAAPQTLGLPGAGVAAAFADIDNDGDLDAHMVPQGLLVNDGGRFRATRRLQIGNPYGISSFADLDADGRRDLLIASGGGAFDPKMRITVLRNRERAGHWLAVDLNGPLANPDGIGARIDVAAGGRIVRQWVGQNEGSRYSQGHYRTYFGLAGRERASQIVVRWPDGTVSDRGGIDADRVLTIDHPSVAGPG
jgi:hypothetical protein